MLVFLFVITSIQLVLFFVGDTFLCRLRCGRRASWRVARRQCRRATTAFDLWFCVRVGGRAASLATASASALGPPEPRHAPRSATRLRHEAAPSGRLAACRQGFPRCTRDTFSTQTLKILGSWMYALAYVNCDSFSFPFLVGGRAAGRQTLRPGGAIASISSESHAWRQSDTVLMLERKLQTIATSVTTLQAERMWTVNCHTRGM